MTLGHIFDHSLSLLLKNLRSLWWIFALQALLTILDHCSSNGFFASLLILGAELGLRIVIFLVLLYTSEALWEGRVLTISACFNRIAATRFFVLFELIVRILFWTLLGLVLFIVPGLVYATNRIMAPYILLIENLSVQDSLRKSKFLFTREPWYSLRGAMVRVSWIAFLTLALGFFAGLFFEMAFPLLSIAQNTGGFEQIPAALFLVAGALVFYGTNLYFALVYFGFYLDLRMRYDR